MLRVHTISLSSIVKEIDLNTATLLSVLDEKMETKRTGWARWTPEEAERNKGITKAQLNDDFIVRTRVPFPIPLADCRPIIQLYGPVQKAQQFYLKLVDRRNIFGSPIHLGPFGNRITDFQLRNNIVLAGTKGSRMFARKCSHLVHPQRS